MEATDCYGAQAAACGYDVRREIPPSHFTLSPLHLLAFTFTSGPFTITFTLHPLCSPSDCASVLVGFKAAAALRAVARGLASLDPDCARLRRSG